MFCVTTNEIILNFFLTNNNVNPGFSCVLINRKNNRINCGKSIGCILYATD